MNGLLARSVAIGTDRMADGEEGVLWLTDEGVRFVTSYEDAAVFG